MKRTKWMGLLLVIGFFLMNSMVPAYEAQAAGVPQTKCPVMANPIDREQFVDYQGKRIYFCCASCLEEFKKDPAKTMKKMQDEGVTLEDVKSK